MSVKLFKTSRWLTVASFAAILVLVNTPAPQPLVVITGAVYVFSFVYTAFFKCKSCGKSYSSKGGFISICWPYTGRCMNCGESLSNDSASNT